MLIVYFLCYFPGTDIKIWHGKTGKNLGTVDTNQLKNTMAAISPNGRFIAAAAFTADVKVNISDYWKKHFVWTLSDISLVCAKQKKLIHTMHHMM